jgi:signal transduction histidine kinase
VVPGLREARSALATAGSGSAAIAAAQVEQAFDDVRLLVEGVPPTLGDGRLQGRLHELASECGVPCVLRVDAHARAGPVVERTLWLVAAECVTNTLKHSGADRLTIDLRREDDELVLVVSDDGSGRADPNGSGLQGLADRVAARRGWWQVVSDPGSGTTVTVRLPVAAS